MARMNAGGVQPCARALNVGLPFNAMAFPTQSTSPFFRHRLTGMQAFVYKSQRKPDTYVYLGKREDFEAIPAAVRATLEPFSFVLEVALTPERKLARVDAALVRSNLTEQGFHLQLPPAPVAPVRVPRIDGRDD